MKKIKRFIKYLNHPIILSRKIIHRVPSNYFRRCILRFPLEQDISREVQLYMKKFEGKTVFVFPLPNCPWGYMFQRPQQLARALAKEGNPVFYMVDTSYPYSPDWNVRGIFEVEPGIFLFNSGSNNPPIEIFNGNKVVIWQYWPHQHDYVQRLKSYAKNVVHIYDCIDDIDTFDSYEKIHSDFRQSLSTADIVLATSLVIYNHISSLCNHVLIVPNGVEVNDFAKPVIEMPEISKIKPLYQAIIGYYGAIAEWFDFKLMKYLSDRYPEWGFIIVGEIYEQVREQVNDLKKQPNVYIINRVAYEEIPSVLKYFDVGIIPFVINDITLSTSPVKAYEYLAGGKEIVSTALPEVEAIDLQFVAYNHIEFGEKVENALSMTNLENRVSYLKSIAGKNTWSERVLRVTDTLLKEERE